MHTHGSRKHTDLERRTELRLLMPCTEHRTRDLEAIGCRL